MSTPFKQNRLADATSPYLLQHKDNPVHWQPWEPAVFDEARRRNVPVLLSIGYAACHWCHVMAHESFEDDEVAALMNAHFVCIKLDREERPDLDEIYMSALSMMGEQGGWPLTMCLDPSGAPFWGGTYFPKTPQYGRPGFMQILSEISRIWHEEPEKIAKNTGALTQSLKARAAADARGTMPADLPRRAASSLNDHMDKTRGGLTGAPKFPQPFLYDFLWQQAQLADDNDMRDNVIFAITRMCQGGIYDHIGGGFARYSVDADWLVPHFEKMLYDNALLISLMTRMWRATRMPLLQTRIEETVEWLMRDMVLRNGAFAASLDADTDGEEGKFYVWSKAEIESVLGEKASAFCTTYDITTHGNFEGHNIPNLLAGGDAPQNDLVGARAVLLEKREQRTKPGRDDKILADWNGIMIAALTEAALVFENDGWLTAAKTAYAAAITALSTKDGLLAHSARDGRQLNVSLAGDYGFMGQAALRLFEATSDNSYLNTALSFAARLQDSFLDPDKGGYLTNQHNAVDLPLVNQRAVHDNAMPSANAAILAFLSRLATLSGDQSYRVVGDNQFAALAGHLGKNFPSMTALLSSHHSLSSPLSIIIIGQSAEAEELARVARRHEIYDACILCLADTDKLIEGHPAFGKSQINGQATVYICPDQTCLPPITNSQALTTALDDLMSARQHLPNS